MSRKGNPLMQTVQLHLDLLNVCMSIDRSVAGVDIILQVISKINLMTKGADM